MASPLYFDQIETPLDFFPVDSVAYFQYKKGPFLASSSTMAEDRQKFLKGMRYSEMSNVS